MPGGKFTSAAMPITGPSSPLSSTGPAPTHEGGAGFSRDSRSDLFLFAAVNMVGEDTFYESGSDRDARFRDLIWQVTRTDPGWVARFVPFLRGEMNMRSASVVMAAEYALCLRHWLQSGDDTTAAYGAPQSRQVIASALQRPDEPGEFIAYWVARTGKRTLPAGVQRGLSDAMARLYTQYAAIKYDGTGQPWRLGDVVELVHPNPVAVTPLSLERATRVLERKSVEELENFTEADFPAYLKVAVAEGVQQQSDLYAYLLDRRHHADDLRVSMERLPRLAAARQFLALPALEQRLTVLADPTVLDHMGLTWEVLSSSGAMDKAAWEAMIPRMGIFAILRNLRNFDQAGVSDEAAKLVTAKLTDPEEIGKSRLFPYRFLSAYQAVQSLRWGPSLETAITLSTANVPALPGHTLILSDTSGSMMQTVSGRSVTTCMDAAALFAAILARRATKVDLVAFASTSEPIPLPRGGSVLKDMDKIRNTGLGLGGGTEMVSALRRHLLPEHDRVVILSDMQAFTDDGDWYSNGSAVSDAIPAKTPAFGVNLAGYATGVLDLSKPNRFEIAGFSDKLFTMLAMLAAGRPTDWPF